MPAALSPEYVPTSTRLLGAAAVGQIVGYGDMANIWEPMEVVAVDRTDPWSPYSLRNLATGAMIRSDCRQPGWTVGRPRVCSTP